MNRSIKILLTSLCIALIVETVASADQCICAKLPMYQVDGNVWYHYAIVYDRPPAGSTDCVQLYPTGLTTDYVFNRVCGPACGNCLSLPTAAHAPADLHFTDSIPNHSAVNTAGTFRAFLAQISGPSHPTYSGWEFKNARVVSLTRIRGGQPETFHAICWKIERTTPTTPPLPDCYIGVEINTPGSGVAVTPVTFQCNAVDTQPTSTLGAPSHTPVRGVLQVKIGSDIAFIRLAKSTNDTLQYDPCYRSNHNFAGAGGSSPQSFAPDSAGSCEVATQPSCSAPYRPVQTSCTVQNCYQNCYMSRRERRRCR